MDENDVKKDGEQVDKKTEDVVSTETKETTYEPTNTVETTYKPQEIETSQNKTSDNKEATTKEVKKEKKEKNTNTDTTKKKGSTKIVIILVLLICLIVGISTAVYFIFFSTKTIDLEKYIKVKYEGYDGFATATVTLDSSLKDEFDDSSMYKAFKKKIELEITSENYDLKNGDTIKIKADISKKWLEKNRLELKDKKITVKASDIPEADTIDVFEDIEITVEGVSPNLYVSVNNNNSDEFIRTVYYSLSDSYGVKNGDTITITANYNEYTAQEMGLIVAKDTMEYKIKDYPFYAAEKDDLSEETISTITADMIEEIKDGNINYGKSKIYYHYSDTYNPTAYYSDDLTAGEPTLVNLYLLSAKDVENEYYTNYAYGIFKVTYTSQETGAPFDWYFATYITDLPVTDDGDIYEDEFDAYYYANYSEGQTAESIYAEYIDDLKSDYIIEKIK